jgi:hypothetical protein
MVALFGLPALLLLVEPRRWRTRHALLLIAPFLLMIAVIAYGTVGENWPLTHARRLYPEVPVLALFVALSWRRLLRPSRSAVVLAVVFTLVLTAAWIDLAGRFLLPG